MRDGRLWLVTLTLGGVPIDPVDVKSALERLSAEHPFLLSGRYAGDCAELRYWEEAETCGDACALALRLWGEHRVSAQLPPWEVLALEVVERGASDRRNGLQEVADVPLTPLTRVAPVSRGAWRSTS
jgi:hypothetical protein